MAHLGGELEKHSVSLRNVFFATVSFVPYVRGKYIGFCYSLLNVWGFLFLQCLTDS